MLIAARIRAELTTLEEVLARATEFAESIGDPQLRGMAIDSTALNVHDLYVGLERLFEAIASNIDRSVPDGRGWHRDLLQQMVLPVPGRRPPVLTREVQDDLGRLLGFRHLVRNVYAYQLDADGVLANVRRAQLVFPHVRDLLLTFSDWLQSLDEGR